MGAAARRSSGASVIIGSDIPSLSLSIVLAACDAAHRMDAVFGPAHDGGYYLVALKSPAHAFRLFEFVRWSGASALGDTLRNVPKHWRIGFLPVLCDVDEAADLKRALQPPANAFVRMISSPVRILRAAKSAGRTASDA